LHFTLCALILFSHELLTFYILLHFIRQLADKIRGEMLETFEA